MSNQDVAQELINQFTSGIKDKRSLDIWAANACAILGWQIREIQLLESLSPTTKIAKPVPPPNRDMGEICGGGFCFETEESKQRRADYMEGKHERIKQ